MEAGEGAVNHQTLLHHRQVMVGVHPHLPYQEVEEDRLHRQLVVEGNRHHQVHRLGAEGVSRNRSIPEHLNLNRGDQASHSHHPLETLAEMGHP